MSYLLIILPNKKNILFSITASFLMFLAHINNINADHEVSEMYINNLLRHHRSVFSTTLNNKTDSRDPNVVLVNKCCEKFEIQVDSICQQVNETEFYQPKFKTTDGKNSINTKFKYIIGLPNCRSMQMWKIFHYGESTDKLILLDNGKLRHYANSEWDQEIDYSEAFDNEKKLVFYDYDQGQYCIDKAVTTPETNKQIIFANICLNQKDLNWNDTSFLLRKLLNPIFHGVSLIILLLISSIYFILPTLRDFIGNIISTTAICLMICQAADLVRIFTEFTNHVSFIVADIILCISTVASFLWLNSFGYYIWKTFRSRNVFLRVTDGRKYCYYSCYVWGCTIVIATLAVFSHFILEAKSYKKQNLIGDQESIGWLGVSIFWAPVAITIIIDIFFYTTTLKLINRRSVYGRIQHKLKANFVLFGLMLLTMSINWAFLILSWFQYEGFLYLHIFVNAALSPFLLYICILRQKHIMFLLKKTCCYNQPPSGNDWGDELDYMRCNNY